MATGHGIDFQVGGSSRRVVLAEFSHLHFARALFFGKMVMLLHFFFGGIASVVCNPTLYDQRQSGKTNVRVEVKDAVIIAVGDGELGGDYDYSYDYSDLTIKPGQPISSTSIPSTTTSAHNKPTTIQASTLSMVTANQSQTENAAIVLEAGNSSIIFPPSKPGNGSLEPIKIPVNAYKPGQIPVVVVHEIHGNRPNKFLPVKTVEKHYVPSSRIRGKGSNGTAINPEELPARRCSPGFFLDDHNRCKRIRRPTRERPQLPIGLRLDQRSHTRS